MKRWMVITVVFALFAGGAAWNTANADEPAPPECTEPEGAPAGSLFVTEDCLDPRFNDGYAFIDIDEVRDTPIPHRFVYGGFRGTEARFAFYFPPDDQYDGRFVQGPIHQLRLTSEIATQEEIEFAFASGAYLVETNNGGSESCLTARDCLNDASKYIAAVRGYRVNAAAAKFSRQVAQRVYGTDARPYGYIYGGSGGAYMTISSAEMTSGVWDGFVPFVFGHPLAIPDHYTVRINALRVLRKRDKLPCIVDAVEPGGSGNPLESCDLDEVERDALLEATRMGFPPGGWFNHDGMTGGALGLVAGYVPLTDPTYKDDFWALDGYLGTEDSAAGDLIRSDRVQHPATVVAAAPDVPPPAPGMPNPSDLYDLMGPAYNYYIVGQYVAGLPPKAIVLDSLPPEGTDLEGADLVIESGPGTGKSCPLMVLDASARLVACGGNSDPDTIDAIGTGDRVRVDNSEYLALQLHHRHQVPDDADYYGWDQFRHGNNGSPTHPQRDVLVGPIGAFNASGSVSTGNFHGKMIMVESILDQDAFAWSADWYRRKVEDHGRTSDYRLWFSDHAVHAGTVDDIHTIDYGGILQQALRDVAAWAEDGTPPPSDTNYSIGSFWGDTQTQAQIRLPATAAERGGIQPVVDLRVDGSPRPDRADIAAGETVEFRATVTVPEGAGEVVCTRWIFEGDFTRPESPIPTVWLVDPGSSLPDPDSFTAPAETCDHRGQTVTLTASHTYTEPGTYFAVLHAASQREGDGATPWAKVPNLARVRVVVE